MNRKYFGYAGFAMLIAIYIGVHLSSATAEARWVRCLVVSRWGLTCQQSNGWGWGSSTAHVRTCPAGHRYWHCHAASRNAHAAHVVRSARRSARRSPRRRRRHVRQRVRQRHVRQRHVRQRHVNRRVKRLSGNRLRDDSNHRRVARSRRSPTKSGLSDRVPRTSRQRLNRLPSSPTARRAAR